MRTTVVTGMRAGMMMLVPIAAAAHCDTLDGPVVTDARAALAAGEVTGVLRWVREADETQIRAAFSHALAVRKLGAEAQELADHFFFETLVRVHRAGEGAPYTGLQPAGSALPIVTRADAALDSGSAEALITQMQSHLRRGVTQRFTAALAAKEHAGHSVAHGRKYVAAYVEYIHYIENARNAIMGASQPHSEPATAPASGHAH